MATLALTKPAIRPTAPGRSRPNPEAVKRLQERIQDDLSLQNSPDDSGLYLRPNAESIFLPQQGAAKGTVVLYHGFTAAPWQYQEMAADLHDSGFNVYVPRMPGHGMAGADGEPNHSLMPRTDQQQVWSEFARQTVDEAAGLGAPVHAVGLSGGGNVALEAGAKNPNVESVTAIAPFLGGNGATGVLFPVLNIVDMVSFGLLGKLLDRLPRQAKPHSPETPKTEGSWGNALAMYRVGARVDKVDARLQVITTEKDPLSGTKKVTRLVEENDRPGNGWYHFPAEERVKHAMVSPQENSNTESVLKIREIVKDFAGEKKPADNPPSGSSSATETSFGAAAPLDLGFLRTV